MLQTVEAEINVDGTVTLLEPIEVKSKTRAIVTVIENGTRPQKGNARQVQELLRSPEFRNRKSYPQEVIDAQIEEARNSW